MNTEDIIDIVKAFGGKFPSQNDEREFKKEITDYINNTQDVFYCCWNLAQSSIDDTAEMLDVELSYAEIKEVVRLYRKFVSQQIQDSDYVDELVRVVKEVTNS